MRVLLTLMLLLAAPMALGADPLSIPAITLGTNAAGAQEYSVSLQILLIMTALSFIPAFVMLMTSFTRIIIVFSILRQALGLQQTPSNQILTGMALFLTLFIMAPVPRVFAGIDNGSAAKATGASKANNSATAKRITACPFADPVLPSIAGQIQGLPTAWYLAPGPAP